MKRLTAIILSALMLFSLTSCGSETVSEEQTDTVSGATETTVEEMDAINSLNRNEKHDWY
ncbi:MAG: hypothetical protein LUF29_08480 [Oscillospiraceae bacterium]|nr:hypothetical protein [Oscillospiraceae bacterium]